ncbi:hypothetical protein NEUTE1DRAFT_150703 [Neurospora tetrasperma FGSC 2508]|uniref:BHLH domain-containing protein n=2 Tax=Neurospora TaxID=5140 RepID=F8N361_NEUT8|nr:uncharacterized protein NEUTE1DRAFT_150703 [Neurospora tetrasperma FGSC 2508]EGO53368.1 hypothetical protein NEUTE1DRAFT_150703 [Neurospora tetrasperma FGSC 2508]
MAQRTSSQKLPLGLAGVLNAPEDNRDSAYYSATDASSKHTSAASGVGVFTPNGSNFQPSPIDKTSPSPTNTSNLQPPQSHLSSVNSNMSVASMVSPTTPGSADPKRFDRPQSYESGPNGAPLTLNSDLEAMSRRGSWDSRHSLNQGFNDMRLGNSPYASQNQSTTSIHQTLQQQRNPRSDMNALTNHRISNGYQPSADRNPDGQSRTRVAPTITGPATSQIARAAEPTKGQAWAFPEEEIQRVTSSSQSLIDSRRSSIAESLASSHFTMDSRLPSGQRRLDDNYPHRLSSVSADFANPTVHHHHHHSLQHRAISDLQNEEGGSHAGSQPYSRTPELRVSHKLAERKRRTEMKELFEQLRDLMPQERGSKASKWEILTKAISEHQRMSNHIQVLTSTLHNKDREIEHLRHELQRAQMEANSLRRSQPTPMGETYGFENRRSQQELPPLRTTLQAAAAAPAPGLDAMTGVQYEAPRVNGFRPPEPNRF